MENIVHEVVSIRVDIASNFFVKKSFILHEPYIKTFGWIDIWKASLRYDSLIDSDNIVLDYFLLLYFFYFIVE